SHQSLTRKSANRSAASGGGVEGTADPKRVRVFCHGDFGVGTPGTCDHSWHGLSHRKGGRRRACKGDAHIQDHRSIRFHLSVYSSLGDDGTLSGHRTAGCCAAGQVRSRLVHAPRLQHQGGHLSSAEPSGGGAVVSPSLQRYLLMGLGGVWCVLMLIRVLMTEAPQEVPLQFVSGKPVAKTRAAVGVPDLWQVKRVSTQVRDMPEGPKKNIFAPLGESTVVGAATVTAKRPKHA